MMQLLCNGVALDIEKSAALSFQKQNPLFAFDDLTCERTQSFTLPDTAKNNRVLSIAKNPAFPGEGMRRRFSAELQDGPVVKRGYLYVDSYDSKGYKAIFVTGDLLGLLNIKNAGTLADLVSEFAPSVAPFSDSYAVDSSNASKDWEIVKYRNNLGAYFLPSYGLGIILQKIATERGYDITWPEGADLFRGIKAEPAGYTNEAAAVTSISNNPDKTTAELQVVNTLNTAELGGLVSIAVRRVGYFKTPDTVASSVEFEYLGFYSVQEYMALADFTITFPENFSPDYFLVDLPDNSEHGGTNVPGDGTYNPGEFLGDYSFRVSVAPPEETGETRDTEYTIVGDPLAGRTVEIKRGQRFTFLDNNIYKHAFFAAGTTNGYVLIGYAYAIHPEDPAWSFTIGVETSARVTDRLQLSANLPDMSFVDACKVIANIKGLLLNYTDRGGLTFEDLADLDAWPILDITNKTTADDTVARKFGNYAQNNAVQFSSNEDVPQAARLATIYTIDNDNIDSAKTLAELPFSEGRNYSGDVFIKETKEEDEDGVTITAGDADTLAIAGSGTYMQRVALTKNSVLQKLCTASTSVSVSAYLPLFRFDQLTAKTLILYRGTRYVWTECTWSKGVAKLSLNAIK